MIPRTPVCTPAALIGPLLHPMSRPMKPLSLSLQGVGAAVVAVLLAFAGPAAAKPHKGAIAISHPWIAVPPRGAPTAAGYVTLKNLGGAPDVFLGGSTPAAANLALHTMSMTGGIMRMRPVSGGLTLAPGATVAMKPMGGLHLMLTGLKHPLKAGEKIPATLRFAHAGEVKTVFAVEASGMAMH
jgi:copper(I)-binding protein